MHEIRHLKQSHIELEEKATRISDSANQQISLLAQEVRQLTALVTQIISSNSPQFNKPMDDSKSLQEIHLNACAPTFNPALTKQPPHHDSPNQNFNAKRPHFSPDFNISDDGMSPYRVVKPPTKRSKPSSKIQLSSTVPSDNQQRMEQRIDNKLEDLLTKIEVEKRLKENISII